MLPLNSLKIALLTVLISCSDSPAIHDTHSRPAASSLQLLHLLKDLLLDLLPGRGLQGPQQLHMDFAHDSNVLQTLLVVTADEVARYSERRRLIS